jgi:hypothetical protein
MVRYSPYTIGIKGEEHAVTDILGIPEREEKDS